MKKIRHVLVLLLFILPMFVLAPSTVAKDQTQSVTTDANVSIPAAFVEQDLSVAVYVENNVSLPAYAEGGIYTNYSANVMSYLQSAGFSVTAITTQDILDYKLLAASYDVFVLPNQLPKDEVINHVYDYWRAGGGILSIGGSIGYLLYMGMIHPSLQGDFGLVGIGPVPYYWYDQPYGNITIEIRNPVTKAFDVDEFILYDDYTAVFNFADLEALVGDAFQTLALDDDSIENGAIFSLDAKYGRIVQVPGNCSVIPDWERIIISDSIDWLAPKTKANIAFDYTHEVFYGVDTLDDNASFTPRYNIFRDTIVNNSFTFDKLYLPQGENITADVLAPFDVLILQNPQVDYTSAEISAIHTWVQNGGGLYIIGESTSFSAENTRLEAIVGDLGISFFNVSSIPGGTEIDEFAVHPLVNEVTSITVPSASYFNVTSPAYPIAYYGEPNVAIAGRDYGTGRILAVGDVNHLDYNYIDVTDNSQWAINTMNWLSSGDAKILVYADHGFDARDPNQIPLMGPVSQALRELDVPFFLTSDINAFNISLYRDDYEMVIYDNINYNTLAYQSDLQNFVEDGGKLIFNTWAYDLAFTGYLGIDHAESIFAAPPELFLWEDAHPLFNLPVDYNAASINSTLDVFGGGGIYGYNFTTFANATNLAGYSPTDDGGAGLLLSAGGRAIINGPLISLYGLDCDDSTYTDNVELWINEIGFLYYDRPTLSHPVDVTYMESETGNNISWSITADRGPVDYVVLENGSSIESGSWTGSPITINVDGINASITEYQITVFDGLGYQVSDIVIVNVTAYTTTTTDTGTGGAPLDPTLILIIGGAAVVVIVIILVIVVKKKK